MRVLHIDTGVEMRGGQWQVLRLVEGMVSAGHEVELLAAKAGPLLRKAVELGLPAKPLRLTALSGASRSFDLVHAHDARAHALAAALTERPVIVSRRVAFPIRRSRASRWKYAHADHYIAVSRFVRDVLVGAGVDPRKISVVYDGVPLPPVAASGDMIVAPATVDPAKGTTLLKEAAKSAGIEIHFSENLESDLKQAALFVYITYQEGLGSAALLAMAAGVPVVASRVGGLQEIVEDGRTGVLIDNTPEEITAAISRLLADDALRREFAARARAHAQEHFSVAAMIHDTLAVYEQVLTC